MIKSKIRRLVIYSFAAALIIFLFLLFHRPAHYKPAPVANSRQLSPYLTHYLIPQFYNGVQLQEPFDMVITEQGINEIVNFLPLSNRSRTVELTSPTVNFASDKILIVAVADFHAAKMIITLEVAPVLDPNGLLNINMDTVKIGAMNVTIPARVIGRKMYSERVSRKDTDSNDIRTLLAASFFDGQPFDPVFTVDGKKIRLTQIAVIDGRLNLHFAPVAGIADAAVLKY